MVGHHYTTLLHNPVLTDIAALIDRRSATALVAFAAIFIVGQGCAARPTASRPSQSAAGSSQKIHASQAPIAEHPDWETIGKSLDGRPIRMRKLGHGPRTVLFIGGIHGDEIEGAATTAALPDAFASAGLEDDVTIFIVEDANPDGRVAATRENANRVDINRNFPARNFDPHNPAGGGAPANQPETRAVVETVDRVTPQLVMVLHSWRDEEFVNFDGPAKALADRFSATSGLPVKASGEFAATPGSLGSYVGRDRGVAVLTIELRKGSDPQKDWLQIRDAVLAAIRGD